MTWSLKLVRKEVKDQIRAGDSDLNVVGYLPARPNPPVVLVGAGDDYLEGLSNKTFTDEAQEFNAKATVRLELRVIAGIGDDDTMQDNLDDLICRTMAQVTNWDIERVSQPFQYTIGSANYLSALIVMTAQIDLEEV